MQVVEANNRQLSDREMEMIVGRAGPATTPLPNGPMVNIPLGGLKFKGQETDPNGLHANAPGAKLDAGKAEYDMVLYSFPDALAHVDRIGKFGAKKYTKGGFLEVPNGQARYFNGEIRHAIKKLRGEDNDPESNELHLAHKAWNALAELQLFLEGKG